MLPVPRDTDNAERASRAIGIAVPAETKNEVREEAEIEGLGELQDFDPHDDDDRPSVERRLRAL